jgi:hypothetical protein
MLGGVLGFLAGPSVDRESPLRALGFVERMLLGRFGRVLFQVAGRGQQHPSFSQAGRPTEVVLVTQMGALFDNLPPSLRNRFAEVPDVIRRLEGHAGALRRRVASLAGELSRLHQTPAAGETDGVAHLESARAGAQARLETAVAALENLRLGLMRLRAGAGAPEQMTAELQRAREIGEAIDRELAARSEVDRVIKRTVTPA